MAAVKTLDEQLNDINFKNSQIAKIRDIQAGKARLKDSLGRNRQTQVSSAGRLSGLETIKNTLGRQFQKALDTTQ